MASTTIYTELTGKWNDLEGVARRFKLSVLGMTIGGLSVFGFGAMSVWRSGINASMVSVGSLLLCMFFCTAPLVAQLQQHVTAIRRVLDSPSVKPTPSFSSETETT